MLTAKNSYDKIFVHIERNLIMGYSQDVIDICEKYTVTGLSKGKKPEYDVARSKLFAATKFLDDSLPEVFMTNRIYCVKNNIHAVPKCRACGEPCGFNAENNSKGFNMYCSNDCRQYASNLSDEVNAKLSDRDWLYEQRITKRMSHKSIAKVLGISERPVIKWCDIHGIPKTQYNRHDQEIHDILDDRDWLFQKYKVEMQSADKIAKELGVAEIVVWQYIKKFEIPVNLSNSYDREHVKQSLGEIELLDFIKSIYDGEIIVGSRSILGDGREIDIYIPEKNLAFEYNGVWSHAYRPHEETYAKRKDASYHKSKTDLCEQNGIHLIQIWSSSWKNKRQIWESRIMAKFGIVQNRIYARNCSIKSISVQEKDSFLTENHLQGKDISSVRLGLYYKDELVSVMTFSKSRFNKKYSWELLRFASKLNTLVIGGFSKLMCAFREKNSGNIVSYADRMHSDGNVYSQNGFTKISVNAPAYHYFKGNEELLNRVQFQKHKISDKNDERTEREIMYDNGYMIVYDCGTITYGME